MKRTKWIKKEDVISALKTEKLERGNWFTSDEPGCKVCAVGAVLRKTSFEKWAHKINFPLSQLGWASVTGKNLIRPRCNGTFEFETKEHLANKNYLAALSNYFESDNYFESNKNKRQCIAFVKKNFPARFKLTIESPKEA